MLSDSRQKDTLPTVEPEKINSNSNQLIAKNVLLDSQKCYLKTYINMYNSCKLFV
jgi:hypothetical protein